jgi:RIO kinase 1
VCSRDHDEFDDFYADDPADAPRRRRRRPDDQPQHDQPQPMRRGRLTESQRARLSELREELGSWDTPEDAPPSGDRWSGWDTADERGPSPYPCWLVTETDAVDTELGILKTGKEADVHLIRREVPGTGRHCLLAAKRYRPPDHRMFHRDAGYLEGRRVRRSRETRAMARRTAYGRNLLADQWAVAEFGSLSRLWSRGAPVPYPVAREGTELLLEFLGEPDGRAAPRLAQLRPGPDELEDLWRQLVGGLECMAALGLAHGDLSAFNLLVHRGRVVIIDLPQAIDVVANPHGIGYLWRDVRTVTSWFRSRGLPDHLADPDEVMSALISKAF